MTYLKPFLWIILFSCSCFQTSGYSTNSCNHSLMATCVSASTIGTPPPVEKGKKKRKRKKASLKRKKQHKHPNKTTDAGSTFTVIAVTLLLLLPIAFLLIGGILGLLGWVIAGTIIGGLWTILGYVFVATQYSIIPFFGLIIFVLGLLISIGCLIWGLIASLASIIIASIILGVLALVGIALLFALS